MKKKVLLVRGHRLNKWEMQNYEPLVKEYDIKGIASFDHRYPLDEIDFPIIKLHTIKEIIGHVPKFRGLFNILFKNRGFKDYLLSLEKFIAEADIVHTLETHMHYIFSYQAALLKKKYRNKLVVTQWENIPFAYEDIPANRKIKSIVRNKADLFIATTERAKEALLIEGVPAHKISIVNYGIDLSRFYPKDKNKNLMNRLSLSEDDIIILFVGRFVWEKGVFEILLATKKLKETMAPSRARKVKCVMVGSGEEEKSLKNTASRLGLENTVKLIEDLAYKDIPEVHSLADIFLLPSISLRTWQEQYGMVLVEAMASGKAIITTHSGSIPEVIGDAGILIPPADHLSLYFALKRFIEDTDMRRDYGRKARSLAEKKYDSRKVSENINEIYRRVLSDS